MGNGTSGGGGGTVRPTKEQPPKPEDTGANPKAPPMTMAEQIEAFHAIAILADRSPSGIQEGTISRRQLEQIRAAWTRGENPRKVFDHSKFPKNPALQAILIHLTGNTGKTAQRAWKRIHRTFKRRLGPIHFSDRAALQSRLAPHAINTIATVMGIRRTSPRGTLKRIDTQMRKRFKKGDDARARLRKRSKG